MDHKKNKTGHENSIHNEKGVALIYALVVMAVIVALALALLYGVGQVSMMTGSYRDQEDCYLQALTLSEVIEKQLADSTSGIYKIAQSYMPDSDSDSTEESIQFTADSLGDGYGKAVVRFQNGVEAINESRAWESKQLSQQYLDLTVEVFGERDGKESVTTRYRFYRELDDQDMEYKLTTNKYTGTEGYYTCEYVAETGDDAGHFVVYDSSSNVEANKLILNGKTVTMEMAEQWAGTVQDGGTEKITVKNTDGTQQSKEVKVTLQLTRTRKILGFGEGNDEYKGKNLKFQKISTR